MKHAVRVIEGRSYQELEDRVNTFLKGRPNISVLNIQYADGAGVNGCSCMIFFKENKKND